MVSLKRLYTLLPYTLGATLWENPKYVSPAAQRSAVKKLKAGKYVARVQAKAAYEANRPTEPTYKVDPTDSVFDTNRYDTTSAKETSSKNKKKANTLHKKGSDKLDNLKCSTVDNASDGSTLTKPGTAADSG